jgi:DNA-binding response OmpR family regulator
LSSLGRILVVDDEEPVRDVLSEYFSGQGYTVDTAETGTDALAAIDRAHPDLILLDIRMPGVDGIEVLRKIRVLDPGLPVIMVTANEDVALARETLKIGAFDYVAKPFDFGYLDRAVAASLARGEGEEAWDKAADAAATSLRDLALSVFRVARAMERAAHRSTGKRMETSALAAAREAAAGRTAEAAEHLSELELLLAIAAELGDVPASERASLESSLDTARRALPE